MSVLSVIALLVTLPVVALQSVSVTPETVTVVGHVIDKDGQPVRDATIAYFPFAGFHAIMPEGTSDSKGIFIDRSSVGRWLDSRDEVQQRVPRAWKNTDPDATTVLFWFVSAIVPPKRPGL